MVLISEEAALSWENLLSGYALTGGFAVFLALIFYAVTRSLATSTLSATVVTLVVFLGGEFLEPTGSSQPMGWLPSLTLILVALALVILVVKFRDKLPRPDPEAVQQGFNWGALALVLGVLLSDPIRTQLLTGLSSKGEVADEEQPHVVLIVLDGYGARDSILAAFDYDIEPFLENLRKLGFYVPERASSNYPFTMNSVLSLMQRDYLPLKSGLSYSQSKKKAREFFTSGTISDLRARGYEFVTFRDTEAKMTTDLPSDKLIVRNGTSDMPLRLLRDSLLPNAYYELLSGRMSDRYETHRANLKFKFSETPELLKAKNPQFIFVHALIPHPPFVFDENGNPIAPNRPFYYGGAEHYKGDREEYRNGYRGQVAYLNKLIIPMVEESYRVASRPTIFILTGDHGFDIDYRLKTPRRDHYWQRYPIFFAMKTPEGNYEGWPTDFTLVNCFRLVSSELFGAPESLLENRRFGAIFPRIFDFFEIKEDVFKIYLPGDPNTESPGES